MSQRLPASARRAQLIDVGRAVFAKHGYEATSVEEIADRAKVSKPIVYEHFGGKEGLYAVVVDREMEYVVRRISEAISSGEPRERVEKASEQGKRPNLWAFFRAMKQIEVKGTMHARRIPRKELLAEYKALSGPQKYYWTHMYELWRLYERQQVALWPLLKSKEDGRWRKRKLKMQFYYLSMSEQKQLVDDWIVERTARERDRRAQELEESLARKTLAKIKADMLAVVSNIDYVLREGRRPHKWQGAFEGI
jgi:hypothetical protein